MKKKLLCLTLVLAMCLSLVACGSPAGNVAEIVCHNCSEEVSSESTFCPHCGAAVAQENLPTENPSPSSSAEQPTEDVANQKFEGYYTNNTDERPPVIQKILDCVEKQLCKSDMLKSGTTHGDIIYYFVEDPNDCFPSAKHPVYSVIVDVSDFNVFGKDGYSVSYIIGFGDIALDLWYTVSYDFSSTELMLLSIRDLNTQETLYGIGYPDIFTAETWDDMLSNVVVAYMPGLCVAPTEHPGENWEAPYCPGDFSKIGETFSEFHVAGSGLQYGPDSLYILMVQEYALSRESWEGYTDYNGYSSRIGVAGDRIVLNVQEMAAGTRLSEALPSDMLSVVPLISYGTDDYGYVCEAMLIWKGDNGYMVGFTEANGYPNGNYLNEYVKYFISTVDLAYILGVPEEILASNPAFSATVTPPEWTPIQKFVTGTVAPTNEAFPAWQLILSEPVEVEDWDGKHTCDVLYFYSDATLNGQPVSAYTGQTIEVGCDAFENYRGGGQFYMYNPTLSAFDNDTPQHNHSYGSWTNTGSSSHTRTCSCGEKETEAHTFDSGKVTKEPTATATGIKTFTCTKCKGTKTETIAMLQHTHSYGSWTKADSSSHMRSCSCGEKETEAHTFDSGKVTKEPTIYSTGVKTYSCTQCGATKAETLPKLEHTHSYGGWSDDHNGSTHSRSCSCGDEESGYHSFDSGYVTKEPTYTSTGVMTYTCYVCGAQEDESIPCIEEPSVFEYDEDLICGLCGHNNGTYHVVMVRGEVTKHSWICSSCGIEHNDTYEMGS